MSIDKMLKFAEKLEARAQAMSVSQKDISSLVAPMKSDITAFVQNWAMKTKFTGSCQGAVNVAWLPVKVGNKIVCNNVVVSFGNMMYNNDPSNVKVRSTLDVTKTQALNRMLASKAPQAKQLIELGVNAGGAFEAMYTQGDGPSHLGKPDGTMIVEINFEIG